MPTLFAMFYLSFPSANYARTSRSSANKSVSFGVKENPTEIFSQGKFMQIYAERSFFDVLEKIVGERIQFIR